MKLWPHQEEAIASCRAQWRRSRSRSCNQFPPGAGKTEVAARLAVEWVTSRPFGRALVVVPSAPILMQFFRRIVALTRLPVGVEKASVRASPHARIVVASQNTLWQRLDGYDRQTLCIYDECHHGNLDARENLRLADSFAHVIGMSATPWSRGCLQLFADSSRVVLPLFQAEQAGLLAPHTLEEWTTPAGPWGLVFCPSNQDAAARSRAHPGSSHIGVHVEERQLADRLARWRSGQVPVLYANRMLLEGFDEPRCTGVWIAKETDSDIMLVQMAGRALRYRPGKRAHIHTLTPQSKEALSQALARCNQPYLKLV